MIPLRDSIPSRTTPFINYLVIAACTFTFLAQQSESPQEASLVDQYGMIPARVLHPERPVEVPDVKVLRTRSGLQLIEATRTAAPSAVAPTWTLLTCVFLHGGWLHFLGNMWFLYIFGDNVEDRFGHIGYVLFYLGSGGVASLAHLLSAPDSMVPTIGASGAIAGVMGAYFVSYPHSRVQALVPIFFFIQILVLPAQLFLGVWFLLQLLQGSGSAETTGIAWWAHIGGFAAGAAVTWMLGLVHFLRPRVTERRPNTDGPIRYYRR